jgi:hypothetical protein
MTIPRASAGRERAGSGAGPDRRTAIRDGIAFGWAAWIIYPATNTLGFLQTSAGEWRR